MDASAANRQLRVHARLRAWTQTHPRDAAVTHHAGARHHDARSPVPRVNASTEAVLGPLEARTTRRGSMVALADVGDQPLESLTALRHSTRPTSQRRTVSPNLRSPRASVRPAQCRGRKGARAVFEETRRNRPAQLDVRRPTKPCHESPHRFGFSLDEFADADVDDDPAIVG